jgi:UDP-N-acetylmuramoylalanine-D-glutamate ligase
LYKKREIIEPRYRFWEEDTQNNFLHKVNSSTKNTYWNNGSSTGLMTVDVDMDYVQPDVLILGGAKKLFDKHHLCSIVQNVDVLILIGDNDCKMELMSVCYNTLVIVNADIQSCVRLCEFIFKDKSILFSPGFLPDEGSVKQRVQAFTVLCRSI